MPPLCCCFYKRCHTDITAEHNKEIVLLQEHIESLKDELLSSEDQKLRLTEVSEENTILKNENYRLEEELIKLRGLDEKCYDFVPLSSCHEAKILSTACMTVLVPHYSTLSHITQRPSLSHIATRPTLPNLHPTLLVHVLTEHIHFNRLIPTRAKTARAKTTIAKTTRAKTETSPSRTMYYVILDLIKNNIHYTVTPV